MGIEFLIAFGLVMLDVRPVAERVKAPDPFRDRAPAALGLAVQHVGGDGHAFSVRVHGHGSLRVAVQPVREIRDRGLDLVHGLRDRDSLGIHAGGGAGRLDH